MLFRSSLWRLLIRLVVISTCTLSTCASGDVAAGLVRGKRATTASVPQPLVFPAQYFEGADGPWSTWILRAGTPEQDLRVTISTASPNTFVVMPDGCSPQVISKPPANCAKARGYLFDPKSSSSWIDRGLNKMNGGDVGVGASLGYNTTAEFGIETIALGTTGPSLFNQTIAGFVDPKPMYLGMLGLGTEPVNYTILGNLSVPSVFTTLKDQNLIPSLSWSYTAGAFYQLKSVYGQLVFGGYDAARIMPNTVDFRLLDDADRNTVVAIQGISFSGTTTRSLLSEPIFAFIDSTDPNIWLPASACRKFAEAFSLELESGSNRYIINSTHREALRSAKPWVAFSLSNDLEGGNSVNIQLPYGAFDKELLYPLAANKTFYFPLRQAANDTQYTLGRTFLQEAYLTVNHEFKNFSVSQCSWGDSTYVPNIITLPGQTAAKSPTPTSGVPPGSIPVPKAKSGIATGALAGIIIAVIAIIALIVGLFIWLCVLRPRRKAKIQALAEEVQEDLRKATIANDMINTPIKPTIIQPAREVWELPSRVNEMDGGEVQSPFLNELASPKSGWSSELESPSLGSETLGSWTTIGRMGSLATPMESPGVGRSRGRGRGGGITELSELQGSDVAQLP